MCLIEIAILGDMLPQLSDIDMYQNCKSDKVTVNVQTGVVVFFSFHENVLKMEISKQYVFFKVFVTIIDFFPLFSLQTQADIFNH